MDANLQSPSERRRLTKEIYFAMILAVILLTALYAAGFFRMMGLRWG